LREEESALMSPRRRIDPSERDYFTFTPDPPRQRRWGLVLVAVFCTLAMAAAITASAVMVVHHERDLAAQYRAAAALTYVRGFMTSYTSLDPFHANDYADRVIEQGTGEFAKEFATKLNEITIRVAQAEPTVGTVLDAGVQRWNDDGSADVLVATKVTTKPSNGAPPTESGSRWVVTTTKEGSLWKISRLIQVI
jgi:Mce-associated membrane protein